MKVRENAFRIMLPNYYEILSAEWVLSEGNLRILFLTKDQIDEYRQKNPDVRGVPSFGCVYLGGLELFPRTDRDGEILIRYTTIHEI